MQKLVILKAVVKNKAALETFNECVSPAMQFSWVYKVCFVFGFGLGKGERCKKGFWKSGHGNPQGLCSRWSDSERYHIWDRLSELFETSSLGWAPPASFGMSCRARFSLVSCRSQVYSLMSYTPSPLSVLRWVSPNPMERWRPLNQQLSTCTEKTGIQADSLHGHLRAPDAPGILQGKDAAKIQTWQGSKLDGDTDVWKTTLHQFSSSSISHGRRQDSLA